MHLWNWLPICRRDTVRPQMLFFKILSWLLMRFLAHGIWSSIFLPSRDQYFLYKKQLFDTNCQDTDATVWGIRCSWNHYLTSALIFSIESKDFLKTGSFQVPDGVLGGNDRFYSNERVKCGTKINGCEPPCDQFYLYKQAHFDTDCQYTDNTLWGTTCLRRR